MKTMILTLIFSMTLNTLAFAGPNESMNALLNEKAEEIARDQQAIDSMREKLKALREAAKGARKDFSFAIKGVVGGMAGLAGTLIVAESMRRPQSNRACVILTLSTLVNVAVLLGSTTYGMKSRYKLAKLENAVDRAQAALDRFEDELKGDLQDLDQIRKKAERE